MEDKSREAFESAMSDTTEPDGLKRLHNAMVGTMTEMLKGMPLWMRVNYVLNSVMHQLSDAPEVQAYQEVNWDKINELLFTNMTENDYNLISHVGSMEELHDLRANLVAASCGLGSWLKLTCKDCGQVFYMDSEEIDFFKRNKLSLPRRCKPCRKLRKDKR